MARHLPGAPHSHRRPHRLRQDPRRLPLLPRWPRSREPERGPRRPDPGRVRLAPEGPLQRHPTQPRRAPGGDLRHRGGEGDAAGRDPSLRPHRRHAPEPASSDGQAAPPHPDHHPGVPLHTPDVRERQEGAAGGTHPHPGRAPRGRRKQARLSPEPVGGAPLLPSGVADHANRALGHPAPHRGDGPVPGG